MGGGIFIEDPGRIYIKLRDEVLKQNSSFKLISIELSIQLVILSTLHQGICTVKMQQTLIPMVQNKATMILNNTTVCSNTQGHKTVIS